MKMSVQSSEKVGRNEDTIKADKLLTFDCGGCKGKYKTKRELNQHQVSCKESLT